MDPGIWFNNILNNFLRIVVWPVFFGVSIIMFVWAGLLFITSHGDPTQLEKARKATIWGVIGIVVGVLSVSVYGIIKKVITG